MCACTMRTLPLIIYFRGIILSCAQHYIIIIILYVLQTGRGCSEYREIAWALGGGGGGGDRRRRRRRPDGDRAPRSSASVDTDR